MKRLLPLSIAFLVCVITAGFLLLTPQNAQVVPVSAVESLRNANFDKLIESAEREQKEVRVIVGIKVNFKVGEESYLRNIDSHQEEIKTAQARFISAIKGHTINPLKYRYIPYLAMSVDADALRQMKGMSDVVSIEKDECWNRHYRKAFR